MYLCVSYHILCISMYLCVSSAGCIPSSLDLVRDTFLFAAKKPDFAFQRNQVFYSDKFKSIGLETIANYKMMYVFEL